MKHLVYLSFLFCIILLSSCTKDSFPEIEKVDLVVRSAERRNPKPKDDFVTTFVTNDTNIEIFCTGTGSSQTLFIKGKDCITVNLPVGKHWNGHSTLNGSCSFTTVTDNQGTLLALRFWIKNPGKKEPLYTTPDMQVVWIEELDGSFTAEFIDEDVWLRRHQHNNGGKILDSEVVRLTFEKIVYSRP